MKQSHLLGTICACLIWIIAPHALWASPVIVTDNTVVSGASDGYAAGDDEYFYGTAIPSTATLIASYGNSNSTTHINYSGDASSATFAHNFTHSIDNTIGDTNSVDEALSLILNFDFTAINNATYSIEGFYAMTGSSGIETLLVVYLIDETLYDYDQQQAHFMFLDETISRNTANASFDLGVIGDGDYHNTNSGSLTGDLIAGHDYSFSIYAWIADIDTQMLAATAEGAVNLTISSVPLPPAVWLFGAGLIGLFGMARGKQAA